MDKIANAYKKCPRCKTKVRDYEKNCTGCGLIFSRLDKANNKNAKKELLSGHKENVVYVKKLPSDVSKLKLFLFTGLLGLFGGHCFYIGRFKRAFFMLIIALASLVIVGLPYSDFYEKFMSFFFILPGILVYMWMADVALVGLGKFKIPVALEREKE